MTSPERGDYYRIGIGGKVFASTEVLQGYNNSNSQVAPYDGKLSSGNYFNPLSQTSKKIGIF